MSANAALGSLGLVVLAAAAGTFFAALSWTVPAVLCGVVVVFFAVLAAVFIVPAATDEALEREARR